MSEETLEVIVTNLQDYTEQLTILVDYMKYCVYGLVILIVLHVIKGA